MSQTSTEAIPEWTLGWRMQRALAHAGLHVEQISDELEVSRSTVSRWINDKGPVRTVYLKQWALRCGVRYDWLKDGKGDGGLVITSSFWSPFSGVSHAA